MVVARRRFFGSSHRAIRSKLQSKPASLKKRPLLDLSSGNRNEMAIHHVIEGFVAASFVPGVATTTLSVLAAENILPATLPVIFAPAITLAAFSLVGIIAGGYQAHVQIKDEQEKVMQLNKELFILFNIAADRYEETQARDHKDEDDVRKVRYNSALERIYKAIMLDETWKANHNEYTSVVGVSSIYSNIEEFKQLRAVIEAYVVHREHADNSNERVLWNFLKNNKKIFQCDNTSPLEYLLKYNSAKQMEDAFNAEMKNYEKRFKKEAAELKKILDEISAGLLGSQVRSQIKELNGIFSSLYDSKHHIVIATAGNLKEKADAAYERIKWNIPINRRKDVQKTWKYLRSILIRVDDYQRNGSSPVCKNIVDSVNDVFGSQGSFRKFWRAPLPDFNFDQMIERPGEVLGKTASLKVAFVSLTSLSSTGVSLYFTALALGAVAMSATGFGLIVAAIALSLTLLSVVCYHRSQQMQLHRHKQLGKFTAARKALFDSEVEHIRTESVRKDIVEYESKDEDQRDEDQRVYLTRRRA